MTQSSSMPTRRSLQAGSIASPSRPRQPDVATVTPLTNEGSLCTLPRSIIDAFDLETERPRIDECAAFVACHSLSLLPEVIAGVGFCMYITREALDLCGLLDEATFGKGYGEEIDFCLRATRVGLRHLVEDSTFVYHRGGGSFGDEQHEGLARGSALLHTRYPYFRAANMRERADDPLRVSFAALELGLCERRPNRPHVLHVLRSAPEELGGTEKFVQSLMESLAADVDFTMLFPVESGYGLQTYWNVGTDRPVELQFLLPGGPVDVTDVSDHVAAAALTTALDMFDFDAVHIQNLIGHSLAPLEVLADFPGPVICSVHDLYLACPNHSLLYRGEQPCGIPDDLEVCKRCLASLPAAREGEQRLTLGYLERFRATVHDHIDTVDRWVFPTQSAADYFLRVYEPDPARVAIIEHGAVIRLDRGEREPDADLIYDEPLRVAFVGLGWAKKGFAVANELAETFRHTSIEIHQFGEVRESISPELRVHGPYDNEYLPELLHGAGIQVVLLPGAYAETFGIVMTEALVAGLPVIGAGYGALGERIRSTGAGWTIDPTDPEGIRALIERLDRCRAELMRATRRVRDVPLYTVNSTASRYAALYGVPAWAAAGDGSG